MRSDICRNTANCFAKQNIGLTGKYYACAILKEAINDYPCPFAKERKEYTDGIHYPFSPAYAKKKEDEE